MAIRIQARELQGLSPHLLFRVSVSGKLIVTHSVGEGIYTVIAWPDLMYWLLSSVFVSDTSCNFQFSVAILQGGV